MIQHLFQCLAKLCTCFHFLRFDIITFGDCDVIRTGNVHKGIALVMEQLLPLPYHAQELVIKNDDLYRGTELHNCTELLDRHLDTTISDNGYHLTVWSTVFGTDRRWQS